MVVFGTAGCADQAGDAIQRGDRLYAEGRFDAAMAEYKFALRGDPDPDALLRLGTAYAARGEVETSRRYFSELIALDSSYRYQVATGLTAAARSALERGGRESAARALEPLIELGTGMIPRDLRLPLARYYWDDNQYEDALPIYLSILADDEEETETGILFETARAFQELGACEEALSYYSEFLAATSRRDARRPGAEWSYGNCLYEAGEEDWYDGRPADALAKIDRLVELGVPQTLMDRAHFLRGELSLALGDGSTALMAFEEVLRLNPSLSGPLVERAEARIREIRFGYD